MASLADRLAEAEAAQHSLLTGSAVVEVRDSNGESIRYRAADQASLAAYVADLRRQIAGTRRPTTVRFQTSKGF